MVLKNDEANQKFEDKTRQANCVKDKTLTKVSKAIDPDHDRCGHRSNNFRKWHRLDYLQQIIMQARV